jgi:hypothetical protein
MLFIKFLLLPRGLPQRDKVVVLSLVVLPYLEDQGIKPVSYPADSRGTAPANPTAGQDSTVV